MGSIPTGGSDAPTRFRVGVFVCVDGPGCLVPHGCSGRRRARLWGRAALCARGRRPARESSAPRASLGASSRSPARPSGPSGALHISAARCADGWLGASSRRLARLRRRPRAPQPGPPIPSAPRLEARPGPPDPPAPSTSVVPGVLMGGSVRRLEARNFNDYMSKREVCAGECLRICAEQALPPSEQFRT